MTWFDEDNKSGVLKLWCKILVALMAIFAIAGIINSCWHKDDTSSPVGKNEVDSLLIDNKRLEVEVKVLDDEKNVEIQKTMVLDNDSTLRKFYELISE